MLFTIQAFIEDYIARRNLQDTDGYAVSIANLYFHKRLSYDEKTFLRRMHRITTVFFSNNDLDRNEFEENLFARLDSKFKKRLPTANPSFPGGLKNEKEKIRQLHRITILSILNEFKATVEASSLSSLFGWTVMLRRGAPKHLKFETLRAFGAQGDIHLNRLDVVLG